MLEEESEGSGPRTPRREQQSCDRLKERVSFYTDMSYGLLLTSGIALVVLTDHTLPAVTYMIGVCLGYALHVGSEMAGFESTVADDS